MPGSNEKNVEKWEKSPATVSFADELTNDCPPAIATPATGTFYAAHRVSPPDRLDFTTAASRDVFRSGNECKRRGNSIVASVDDARHLCRAHPDSYAYVSEGVLTNAHGMLVRDETRKLPSHHTLWRLSGVTMHSIFTKVV